MTYNLAICDDEPAELEYLATLVKIWGSSKSASGNIIASSTCFSSAEAFLFHYEEDKSFDILLLDIEMGAINGVELAKTIRSENKDVQIIFVTGYIDYIAEGYEVEALHYLMKPVTEEKFFSVLDRAIDKLKRNEKVLIINIGGQSVRIPLYTIRYLEAHRNYVTIHTNLASRTSDQAKTENQSNECYTIKATLSSLEGDLDENFFRTGRSFIVNLNYIRKVTKTEIIFTDGTVIPLPRGQYEAVNNAIISQHS